MTKFTTHTIDTAPEAAKPILEATKKAFGFVPNLSGNMANSPELLAGYSALWDLFGKTSLTPTDQQVVYMTSIYENECRYCMAGHTQLSKMQRIDGDIIAALRSGARLADGKLEALHVFTGLVVRNRGWIADADVDAFIAAGYTRQNVLEVVLGVATKVISNYTNHITHTDYDAFMSGAEWAKPGSKAA